MTANHPIPSTTTAALRGLLGRCPRCGEGRLFNGLLTPRAACESCGLDYGFADSGDGPVIFVILIAGAVLAAAALITEFKYAPPFWVHAALWGPLAVLVCVGPLRPLKGLLIALQYHFQAREGRLTDKDAS